MQELKNVIPNEDLVMENNPNDMFDFKRAILLCILFQWKEGGKEA